VAAREGGEKATNPININAAEAAHREKMVQRRILALPFVKTQASPSDDQFVLRINTPFPLLCLE
jgi:hypothetical protein